MAVLAQLLSAPPSATEVLLMLVAIMSPMAMMPRAICAKDNKAAQPSAMTAAQSSQALCCSIHQRASSWQPAHACALQYVVMNVLMDGPRGD
jgi:hypothetical protein